MVKGTICPVKRGTKHLRRVRTDYRLNIFWGKIFVDQKRQKKLAHRWVKVQLWFVDQDNTTVGYRAAYKEERKNEALLSAAHSIYVKDLAVRDLANLN